MRPMTVRSSNGLIHAMLTMDDREGISICGIFYVRERVVPSRVITCLRCARNKFNHRPMADEPEA